MAKTKNPELEQQRRTLIMETVACMLAEGSHRSLTLAAVARQAGVSKGMVTYYFPSKQQLISEAIAFFLDRQQRLLDAVARSERPIRERLEALVSVALPDRAELERQLRLQTEVLSFAKDVPEALAAVRASYGRFREACRAILAVGVDEGYVTTPDTQWLYVALHALLDGLSIQLVLDERLDVDATRARLVELIDSLVHREPARR